MRLRYLIWSNPMILQREPRIGTALSIYTVLTSVPRSLILARASSRRFPCSTPDVTSGMGMSLCEDECECNLLTPTSHPHSSQSHLHILHSYHLTAMLYSPTNPPPSLPLHTVHPSHPPPTHSLSPSQPPTLTASPTHSLPHLQPLLLASPSLPLPLTASQTLPLTASPLSLPPHCLPHSQPLPLTASHTHSLFPQPPPSLPLPTHSLSPSQPPTLTASPLSLPPHSTIFLSYLCTRYTLVHGGTNAKILATRSTRTFGG